MNDHDYGRFSFILKLQFYNFILVGWIKKFQFYDYVICQLKSVASLDLGIRNFYYDYMSTFRNRIASVAINIFLLQEDVYHNTTLVLAYFSLISNAMEVMKKTLFATQ